MKIALALALGLLSFVGAASDADRQVRAMVKECRELLAADKLDEVVEKVKGREKVVESFGPSMLGWGNRADASKRELYR